MKKYFLIFFLMFLCVSFSLSAKEIFLLNNQLVSPASVENSVSEKSNSPAFASPASQLKPISPFFPSISNYSLDNGYSMKIRNGICYLSFIDAGSSQLILQLSYDGGITWTEKNILCSVEYNLYNGLSMAINHKKIYIALKENNKLYLIKYSVKEKSFDKKLVSSQITGIPDIKINNENLYILFAENNFPVLYKSYDYGVTWIKENDISGRHLQCLNNPSYGIAKPQIYNVAKNKLLAVYASPELTIQASNDNGKTWNEPMIISDESVLNGFSITCQQDDLHCFWINQNEIIEKKLSLKSIGIIPGASAAANLNNVVVYPNPFKPSTSINGYVTFANVTSDVELKIYTLAGELVDEKSLTGTTGKITWDCKNKQGQAVASGIYLYLLQNSSGEKITGKLVVIR